MENYYKILEVDKDASPEIIEKAYKLLVKKYHPDLQDDADKSLAEEKIKKINEAYSILSDSNQRQNYNNQLQENTISVEQYQLVVDENKRLKKELVYIAEELKNINHPNSSTETVFNPGNKANNNYSNINNNFDVNKNENYSQPQQTKKQHTFIKRFFKIFCVTLFMTLVIFILLRAPFFQNIINTIFDSNILIVVIIVIILFFSSKR
ncbi:MAG: J domain-containing protein [Clostridia bacterium]|nr:J domain-containing protein [Clostridia bacterium]